MSHNIFRGLLSGTGGGGGGGGGSPATADTSAYIHYHAMAVTPQTDGTTLAYTSVLDQSGNGRHTTGAGGGGHLYNTNSFGTGKPGFGFTPGGWFSLPSLAALTEGEVFIVAYNSNDPASFGTAGSIAHLGTGAFDGTLFPYQDGTIYDGFGSTVRKTTVNPTPVLTTPRLYNVVSAAGEWTSRLDTTQIFTTATNTVGFPSNPTLGGGTLDSGGSFQSSEGFFGAIGEFRLFSSKRTAPQRAAIEAIIKSTWGLTGW